MFKTDDEIVIFKDPGSEWETGFEGSNLIMHGTTPSIPQNGIIIARNGSRYLVRYIVGRRVMQLSIPEDHMKLLKNNNKKDMSIQSKLKELLRKEPQKSLVKTGILNDNEEFTTEGKEVFLNYLLEKNIDDFNTTVIQPLLEAQKEEKNS